MNDRPWDKVKTLVEEWKRIQESMELPGSIVPIEKTGVVISDEPFYNITPDLSIHHRTCELRRGESECTC